MVLSGLSGNCDEDDGLPYLTHHLSASLTHHSLVFSKGYCGYGANTPHIRGTPLR